MKPKLALVGSGAIAPFHIEAALAAGFEITAITSSANSKSALDLKEKFNIPRYFPFLDDLLGSSLFDCLSVMVQPDKISPLLEKLSLLSIPILIEKPVAISSNALEPFVENKNLLVGYNRRFYSTISELRKNIEHKDGIFLFDIIESSESNFPSMKHLSNSIKTNSVHMIDLMFFILGKHQLSDFVYSPTNSTLKCRILINREYKGDLQISFNSNKNTKIEFENDKIRIEVKPLESLQKFNNMKVIEPVAGKAFRSYVPYWSDENVPNVTQEDGVYKPGFIEQYKEFKLFCESGRNPENLASLKDAQNALRHAEIIIEVYNSFMSDDVIVS